VDKAAPIVSLQSLSPVFAETMLPQQTLAAIKPGLTVHVATDAFPEKVFDGTLTAINPDFDPASRSVRVQATMPNAEQLLHPGMFTRIEILLSGENSVLAIPATAVMSAPYGDSVYVVEPATNAAGGLVVRQQLVRVAATKGDFVSVTGGLKAGERVVSSGLFKLRTGMSVVENNELTPKSDKKPNPSDG
jgi:membrane fusion protein (multidrug efflux system)